MRSCCQGIQGLDCIIMLLGIPKSESRLQHIYVQCVPEESRASCSSPTASHAWGDGVFWAPTVIWGCVGVQAELSNLITTPPVGECATVSFLLTAPRGSAFTPTQLSPSYLAYYLATSDITKMSSTDPKFHELHQQLFEAGLQVRRSVVGEAYVERALANGSTEFSKPGQELVT